MRIRRVKSKGIVLSSLPASQLALLQQIPLHADPSGSPAAAARLYQSPIKHPLNPADDAVVNDWNDYVVPDLHDDFARQLDLVSADLRLVQPQPPTARTDSQHQTDSEDDPPTTTPSRYYELTIPFDHLESWYGALNQARLVMQERYQFPEIENLAAIVSLLTSENLKPYLASRFYTEIQAALLDLGMDQK